MDKLLFNENVIKSKNLVCLQINLLNACTSKCRSCRKYTWPKDILNVSDVKALISWFAKQGGQSIIFSGGDPILYKDLEEVCLYAESFGIKWSIFTTLITTNKKIIKFLGEHAHRLHISVDAVKKEKYKYIRGVDCWNIVDENLKLLQSYRKNKIPVRLSSTISSFNFNDCIELFEYAKETNILIKFYPAQSWVDKSAYDLEDIGMNKEQLEAFYLQMDAIAKMEKEEKSVISNAKNMILNQYEYDKSVSGQRCYISSINALVNANGDIYPCCKCLDDNGLYGPQMKYVYGNIKNKSEEQLVEIFEKRHMPKCNLFADCFARYGYDFIQDIEKIITENNIKNTLFI